MTYYLSNIKALAMQKYPLYEGYAIVYIWKSYKCFSPFCMLASTLVCDFFHTLFNCNLLSIICALLESKRSTKRASAIQMKSCMTRISWEKETL